MTNVCLPVGFATGNPMAFEGGKGEHNNLDSWVAEGK